MSINGKVLSVTVALQLTDLRYQRRSDLDVNNQVKARGEQGVDAPYHHFRYNFACTAGRCTLQFHGSEDEEGLFVRDIDAFDDLEAREPFNFELAASVFLTIYNEYPLNADLRSYSKAFDFGEKIFEHKSKKGDRTFHSRGFEDEEDLFVRDIDAFDDLEEHEPFNFGPVVSVFLTIYNKYPLNADLRSYSKEFEIEEKFLKDKIAKGANRFANAVDAFQSRGFEDEEDLSERDIDAFYDLEAREPWYIGPAVSVFLTLYNKYDPLNADLRSYSKNGIEKGKKFVNDPRTKKYAKRFGNIISGVQAAEQLASLAF